MSVLDAALEFSDAQAITSTSAGASVKSTNVSYRPAGKNAWGGTKNTELGGLIFNAEVNVAMVGAGAIVTANLVTKADASISSGATTVASVQFPAASAAGTRKSVKINEGTEDLGYWGVLYTVSGAKLTSATFDSYMNLSNEVPG